MTNAIESPLKNVDLIDAKAELTYKLNAFKV